MNKQQFEIWDIVTDSLTSIEGRVNKLATRENDAERTGGIVGAIVVGIAFLIILTAFWLVNGPAPTPSLPPIPSVLLDTPSNDHGGIRWTDSAYVGSRQASPELQHTYYIERAERDSILKSDEARMSGEKYLDADEAYTGCHVDTSAEGDSLVRVGKARFYNPWYVELKPPIFWYCMFVSCCWGGSDRVFEIHHEPTDFELRQLIWGKHDSIPDQHHILFLEGLRKKEEAYDFRNEHEEQLGKMFDNWINAPSSMEKAARYTAH